MPHATPCHSASEAPPRANSGRLTVAFGLCLDLAFAALLMPALPLLFLLLSLSSDTRENERRDKGRGFVPSNPYKDGERLGTLHYHLQPFLE